MNRRHFLGLAGISALVLGAGRSLPRVLSPAEGTADATASAAAGTRWAMLVDTKKCIELDGCTRCVEACHAAHNVPRISEPRHEVKWMWKARYDGAFAASSGDHAPEALRQATLPVLCNHCEKPPCTRVCPTGATWKRDDGLVMMDEHRCIGCRYCMAACPYGSRSFNWMDPRERLARVNRDYPTRTKGVVEKCTFCDERVDKGQLPVCVEACPNGGLLFGNLADARSQIRTVLAVRYSVRRKPELGTGPAVYYLI
ncbi:MAG: sulfate reduction electron transfer complex DsrMKJOP subunit DsrO [Bacteroidales bacterium]